MAKLTVQHLIDLLSKIEDKSKPVVIDIRQRNKVYGVALVPAWPDDDRYLCQDALGNVRLNASLPDNMFTVEKKTGKVGGW